MFDAVQKVTRVLNTIGDVFGFLNVLMHFNCGVVECEFKETEVSHEHCYTITSDISSDVVIDHSDCYTISSDSLEQQEEPPETHTDCGPIESEMTGEYSIKNFLNYYNDIGIQVKNSYEVRFLGANTNLNNIVFYIQNISLPGMVYNMTEIKYDGHIVNVPVNYDYSHDISMTVINDAQGYIYNFLFNYFKLQRTLIKLDSNCVLLVSAISGGHTLDYKYGYELDPIHKDYTGMRIALFGVRFTEIGGLDFGVNNNEIQTFTITAKCLKYELMY